MIRNQRVDPASLPQVGHHSFEALESRYLQQQKFWWLVVVVIVAVAAIIIGSLTPMPLWVSALIIVGTIALSLLGVVIETKAFAHRGWLLREHDITSRRGLIGRTTTTAPFVRVQHVTVNQGPVDRLFKIASLNVFTAGAGLADLVIPGLDPDRAAQLRETLIDRSESARANPARLDQDSEPPNLAPPNLETQNPGPLNLETQDPGPLEGR